MATVAKSAGGSAGIINVCSSSTLAACTFLGTQSASFINNTYRRIHLYTPKAFPNTRLHIDHPKHPHTGSAIINIIQGRSATASTRQA